MLAGLALVCAAPPVSNSLSGTDPRVKPRVVKRQDAPNVLIFLTDDQRYEGTMSMLPSVEKWFGRGGVEFTRSYVTTPLCCPSRATILTGRYTHNHHVVKNGREAVKRLRFSETLPAYLKRAGYQTALFGKYFNKWPKDRRPRFFDTFAVSGGDYYGARFNVDGRVEEVERYATDYVADRASDFVTDMSGHRAPWLLYVAPVAVHGPYLPKKRYADSQIPARVPDRSVNEDDRSDKPPWVSDRRLSRPRDVDRKHDGQLRALISVDEMIDQVMTALEETGQADNTLAIFMSDNGFLWGEHGLGQKKYPYIPSVQIPLYVRWPGHLAAGTTDARLAANVDITPTVLDAVGIESRDDLDGLSLLAAKRRSALFLEFVSDFKKDLPHWRSVLTHTDQYIEYFSRRGKRIYTEYYDLINDPSQMNNLLGDADAANNPPWPVLERLEMLAERGASCRGSSCHL